ncbi:MAG: class I SAM-dependent methyltransferase [Hormoscilla sp. GM7CHS1pb]|nr:class I SAM-dependent methyltransferase [Hormoscilla sp. GM7CHS1pb]
MKKANSLKDNVPLLEHRQNYPTNYQGASAQAIQHHYDAGNEFYQLWLDSTLTYSCALWDEHDSNDCLETAQLRKLDYYIEQARAKAVERVLEIGSGWGSMAKRLVEVHDVKQVTTLTLSQAQLDWIQSFNNPQIDIRLENWCDHCPPEPYDAIISVAAFEAFAKLGLSETEKIEAYRCFFEKCHQCLKAGRWMSLQTIIYENANVETFSKFMGEEIFPESDLPHLSEIAKATQGLFEIIVMRNDRQHYERTLKVWLKNLKENRSKAIELAGENLVSRYEKYLSFCAIGFYTGTMNLSRSIKQLNTAVL